MAALACRPGPGISDGSDLIEQLAVAHAIEVALIFRFEGSAMTWPSTRCVRTLCLGPMVVLLPDSWAAEAGDTVSLADLEPLPWISHFAGTVGELAAARAWVSHGLAPPLVQRW